MARWNFVNCWLLCIACLGAPVMADTTTFSLVNNTGLNNATVYVAGYSTAGGSNGGGLQLQLNPGTNTGVWVTPTFQKGTIPCYELGSGQNQINQITLDSSQPALSGKVFFFVVNPDMNLSNTTCSSSGFFGQATLFNYTNFLANIVQPTLSQALTSQIPPWAFVEVGASSKNATVDVSQVDFIGFPINTVAYAPNTPGQPHFKQGVGNSFDPGTTALMTSSLQQVLNSWNQWYTAALSSSPARFKNAYGQLVLSYPDASTGPYSLLLNPGNFISYVSTVTPSVDQTQAVETYKSYFDNLANNYVWKTWAGSVQAGGIIGQEPNQTYQGSVVQVNYPGTTTPVNALKFVGETNQDVYFLFSPNDIKTHCKVSAPKGAWQSLSPIPSICASSDAINSVGYQIFAAAGALGSPPNDQVKGIASAPSSYGMSATQAALIMAEINDPANNGASPTYAGVTARLAFFVDTAFNRGVAGLKTCTYGSDPAGTSALGTCWQDENQWYPTASSAQSQITQNTATWFPIAGTAIPDLRQNMFSLWVHTGLNQDGTTPLFARPFQSSQKSAGGALMGMGYGFSYDENPTPNPPDGSLNSMQQEVPSKYDSNIVYGTTGSAYNFITLGPVGLGAGASDVANPSPNATKRAPPYPTPQCGTESLMPLLSPTQPATNPTNAVLCAGGAEASNLVWSYKTGTYPQYTWSCNFAANPAPATPCATPQPQTWPLCGAANGQSTTTTAPAAGALCATGSSQSLKSATGVYSGGRNNGMTFGLWTWSCTNPVTGFTQNPVTNCATTPTPCSSLPGFQGC